MTHYELARAFIAREIERRFADTPGATIHVTDVVALIKATEPPDGHKEQTERA